MARQIWNLSFIVVYLYFRKLICNNLLHDPTCFAAIQQGLSEAPVVALLGARQVGKTTLARVVASGWQGTVAEFDLEDVAAREALSATPDTLLRRQEGLVVLDEVQRLPQLFEVLRPICDDPDCQAVFLLLGSASWDVIKGVSETLAGRIQFVDVAGLALTEVGTSNQDTLWMRGGFPRAFLATSAPTWVRWMRSFTSTFLERDIPMLSPRTSGRGRRPLLAHACPLSRAGLELVSIQPLHGRQRHRH